jgi:hypothetical protein
MYPLFSSAFEYSGKISKKPISESFLRCPHQSETNAHSSNNAGVRERQILALYNFFVRISGRSFHDGFRDEVLRHPRGQPGRLRSRSQEGLQKVGPQVPPGQESRCQCDMQQFLLVTDPAVQLARVLILVRFLHTNYVHAVRMLSYVLFCLQPY